MLSETLKAAIKARLPRGLNIGPPVVQLFVNDGRTTRLGMVNFPSLFAPQEAQDYCYALRAFDAEGHEVRRARLNVPRYGSAEVDLRSALGSDLPPWGMVAARIYPSHFFSLGDRHLGRIRPHFFTLYADSRMESLGLVHPQTNLDALPAPERRWVSNLEIDPAVVSAVEVFQVNPGRTPVDSEFFLQGDGGAILVRTTVHLPPRGTRRMVFALTQYSAQAGTVSVGMQGLAAANGKPILFLHFRDGSFTSCHA